MKKKTAVNLATRAVTFQIIVTAGCHSEHLLLIEKVVYSVE